MKKSDAIHHLYIHRPLQIEADNLIDSHESTPLHNKRDAEVTG